MKSYYFEIMGTMTGSYVIVRSETQVEADDAIGDIFHHWHRVIYPDRNLLCTLLVTPAGTVLEDPLEEYDYITQKKISGGVTRYSGCTGPGITASPSMVVIHMPSSRSVTSCLRAWAAGLKLEERKEAD